MVLKTYYLFTGTGKKVTVDFELGKIHQEAESIFNDFLDQGENFAKLKAEEFINNEMRILRELRKGEIRWQT